MTKQATVGGSGDRLHEPREGGYRFVLMLIPGLSVAIELARVLLFMIQPMVSSRKCDQDGGAVQVQPISRPQAMALNSRSVANTRPV